MDKDVVVVEDCHNSIQIKANAALRVKRVVW
jgi:hypothetical protein